MALGHGLGTWPWDVALGHGTGCKRLAASILEEGEDGFWRRVGSDEWKDLRGRVGGRRGSEFEGVEVPQIRSSLVHMNMNMDKDMDKDMDMNLDMDTHAHVRTHLHAVPPEIPALHPQMQPGALCDGDGRKRERR
jgi:hypothetical protein